MSKLQHDAPSLAGMDAGKRFSPVLPWALLPWAAISRGLPGCAEHYGHFSCAPPSMLGLRQYSSWHVVTDSKERGDAEGLGFSPEPSTPNPKPAEGLLQELEDLVALCLARDPQQRPSAAHLLKHSFFKQASKHPQHVRVVTPHLFPPEPPLLLLPHPATFWVKMASLSSLSIM